MNFVTRIVTAVLLAGISAWLHAAPDGAVTGNIRDASTHAPLAGANVVIIGREAGAAADRSGRFLVENLPAGTYSLEASYMGYRAQVKTDIVVRPNRTTELTFLLEPSRIALNEVRVRPDYFPKAPDAPVSATNFTTEEVKSQPGGIGDIQRVVQSLPGVVSPGDEDNQVIVRGGGPNENLLLIDGFEVANPNHFGLYNGQGGVTMLNPLLIREVSFITGAFPARYGDRASSVMDITLRDGSPRRIEGSLDLGIFGVGAVLEGPLPGRVGSCIGSYHKSFVGLLAAADVYGTTAVPYYDDWLLKLSLKPAAGHDVSALAAYGADHIEIKPGELGDELSDYTQQTARTVVGASWQMLFGSAGYGRLLLSGTGADYNMLETADTTLTDTVFHALTRENAYTGRYDATFRWLAGHETQAGISASHTPFSQVVYSAPDTLFFYEYNPDGSIKNRYPVIDTLTGQAEVNTVDVESDFNAWKYAAYLQHSIRVLGRASLFGGVRYDRFDFTGSSSVSPRFGLTTDPVLAGLVFGLGFGVHYQSPPFWILARDTANSRLRDQRSDHYVVRVERAIGADSRASVEVYRKNLTGVLIPQAWTTADPYDAGEAWVDKGRGYAQGIELFLQKKHSRNWYGALSCSFSRSRLVHPRDSSRTIPGEFDYGQVIAAMGAYKVPFRQYGWYQRLPGWFRYTVGALLLSDEADIGMRFRYLGGRPYTPQEWIPETRHWVENDALLRAGRLPAYHRLDVRWDHKFIFNRWSVAWYFELQNVYDRANVWDYRYSSSGKRDTLYQFRLFPVGGLVIEF